MHYPSTHSKISTSLMYLNWQDEGIRHEPRESPGWSAPRTAVPRSPSHWAQAAKLKRPSRQESGTSPRQRPAGLCHTDTMGHQQRETANIWCLLTPTASAGGPCLTRGSGSPSWTQPPSPPQLEREQSSEQMGARGVLHASSSTQMAYK